MIAELIARLEVATGADRTLDWEIHNLIFPERGERFGPAKSYSSSIDAALTLVPEGWRTCVVSEYDDGTWFWALHNNSIVKRVHSSFAFDMGGHKPAPIAICIAALKARAVTPSLGFDSAELGDPMNPHYQSGDNYGKPEK